MRLYVILAAVALFLGAGVYVVQLQKKANRVDAAEEALKTAQDQFAANVDRLTKAAETNRQIASDLAVFRGEQADFRTFFQQEIGKRPIVRETIREVNGQQVSCLERDPERYRVLFNSAVTGTANP